MILFTAIEQLFPFFYQSNRLVCNRGNRHLAVVKGHGPLESRLGLLVIRVDGQHLVQRGNHLVQVFGEPGAPDPSLFIRVVNFSGALEEPVGPGFLTDLCEISPQDHQRWDLGHVTGIDFSVDTVFECRARLRVAGR